MNYNQSIIKRTRVRCAMRDIIYNVGIAFNQILAYPLQNISTIYIINNRREKLFQKYLL